MPLSAPALLLALALAGPALAAAPAPPPPAGILRVSYWSTRPGKGADARAFWTPIAAIFADLKRQGLLVDYVFLTPEFHTGQDWDLAYLWVCTDVAAYGKADQAFTDAVAKLDEKKIDVDFDAAFDGSRHRDELWETTDPQGFPPGTGLLHVFTWSAREGQGKEFGDAMESFDPIFGQMQREGLLLGYRRVAPFLHTGQDWDGAWIWVGRDMAAWGRAFQAYLDARPQALVRLTREAIDFGRHRDQLWKVVPIP